MALKIVSEIITPGVERTTVNPIDVVDEFEFVTYRIVGDEPAQPRNFDDTYTPVDTRTAEIRMRYTSADRVTEIIHDVSVPYVDVKDLTTAEEFLKVAIAALRKDLEGTKPIPEHALDTFIAPEPEATEGPDHAEDPNQLGEKARAALAAGSSYAEAAKIDAAEAEAAHVGASAPAPTDQPTQTIVEAAAAAAQEARG